MTSPLPSPRLTLPRVPRSYLMQLNMVYNKHRAKEGKALTSEELQSRCVACPPLPPATRLC